MKKVYENKDSKLTLSIGKTGNGHVLTSMNGKESIHWTETEFRGFNSIEFKLDSKCILIHPEHAPIVLEPGVYTRTIQLEFNPFDNTVGYIFD
jgi:hypothetical protein